jgi:hypothetical protein
MPRYIPPNPPLSHLARVFAMHLVLLSAATAAHGQTAPQLDGHLEVDPTTGFLRGDICLSKLPRPQTESFLLNRGLNIREVRDAVSGKPLSYTGFYDAVGVGDATRYRIDGGAGASGFCVSYVGAYPVYRVDAGERSGPDWKGQIAFDGRTVRAAEQTRFYPVALDSVTGAALDSASYRLEVVCSGCSAIYLNGSAPAAGPQATFSSVTPRQLMLYAGAFSYASVGGVHFVGASVSAADADVIRSGTRAMADAHAAYMGIPNGDEPAYLTFASVSRERKIGQTTWQFMTWPTIAMDGRVPFSQLPQEIGDRRAFGPDKYIAHEMAHYYFGTRYVPRGPLRWFLLESTAEFMALKAHRALAGEAAYAAFVRADFKQALAIANVVPLDSVDAPEQIGEDYRYCLGPLLLIALEHYAGEDVVRRTLTGLISDPPTEELRYPAFRARLISAGATVPALTTFETECLHRSVKAGCLSALPQVR